MTRRRILFGATEWITVDTFLLDQAAFFSQAGWEVAIVSSGVPAQALSEEANRGLRIYQIPMVRNPALWRDFAAFLRWVEVLRLWNPEVFVGSTPKASFLGLLAAGLLRVRSRIYWVHGLRYETARGLRRKIFRAVEKICIGVSTGVLPVSKSIRSELVVLAPGSARKMATVLQSHANGVDVDLMAPASQAQKRSARSGLKISADRVVLGFVGRLNRDKGIQFLAEAMETVCQQFPSALLLLVGDDDDTNPLDPSTTAFLSSAGVRRIGFQAEIVEVYHALDVLVNASLREGLSTVNLEAASCGLPVITTSATGCIDSIEPGKTGLMVPPGDSASLAEAILLLLKNEGLRHAFGMNGRRWVQQNFVRQKVWESNLTFFNSL